MFLICCYGCSIIIRMYCFYDISCVSSRVEVAVVLRNGNKYLGL
jgi:hypothetical protein